MSTDARIFPCVLCTRKFSMVDVEALAYFADSQVCRACYLQGRGPACLGRYNKTEEACTRLCPDRRVCFQWPEYVQIEDHGNTIFKAATQKLAEQKLQQAKERGRERSAGAPFRSTSMIGTFFDRATRPAGLPLPELRAVCAEIEASHTDYYRRLYSGVGGGWTWEPELLTVDGVQVLRIANVRQIIKGKGKR